MTDRTWGVRSLFTRFHAVGGNAALSFPEWMKLMSVLLLCTVAVRWLHLEEELLLPTLMPYLVGGMAIYTWLPISWRMPFMFWLNLAAMVGLLGWSDGLLLAGLALGLFGIAHLPLSIAYRIGAVLLAAGLLALFRAGWLTSVDQPRVLSILGSMFMFRMVLYLYELRFERQPVSIWHRLAYFFMLPNLVFVIFPVVDYQTFSRGYYARPSFQVQRTALLRMANGIIHLLAYRLVNYYLLPDPTEVDGLLDWAQYLVVTYLLIIRLAGIFHLSVGILGLFGFDLPPVFHHYFFADSFSDLWRRINIYWRDFVVKVFYLPLYFRFKHRGQVFAMTTAILLVFVVNWFLHSYQWFWVRGDFPLTVQDAVFWSVFGAVVAVNSVRETKRKIRPPLPGQFSLPSAGLRMLRIMGVFFSMVLLWSFWTSASVREWVFFMGLAGRASAGEIIRLSAWLLAVFLTGLAVQYLQASWDRRRDLRYAGTDYPLAIVSALLCLLVVGAQPAVYHTLEQQFSFSMDPVLHTRQNKPEAEAEFNGYYEQLLVGNGLGERLPTARPARKRTAAIHVLSYEQQDNLRGKVLTPLQRAFFKGAWLTTNEFGMRDRTYPLEKSARTVRILLLGTSVEMGTGVETMGTFENLVEEEMNRSNLLGEDIRVEILNLAVSGNQLYRNLARLTTEGERYDPDVILYCAHRNERSVIKYIVGDIKNGRDLMFPFLDSLLASNGISADLPKAQIQWIGSKVGPDACRMGYEHLTTYCNRRGWVPVWCFVPVPKSIVSVAEQVEESKELSVLAEETGFGYCLDLSAAYDGHDPELLRVAKNDIHPNALGHRLLADALLAQLRSDESLLSALRDCVREGSH